MYQIITGKENITLSELSILHLNKLSYKSDGNYREYSPAMLLSKRINTYKPRKERNKISFFNKWKENDYELLKRVITTGTTDIPELIIEIDKLLQLHNLSMENVKTEFEEIFRYDNWRGTQNCKWLYEQLDILVCPYCNSEEVYTTKEKLYVEFDHYYSQAKFPYLALSFFNLIPCCHNCNVTCKGSKPFCIKTHLHPYLDNYHFISKFKTDTIALKYNDEFNVNIYPIANNHSTRWDKYNEDLSLTERYNRETVKKRVIDLKGLRDKYSDSKIQEVILSDLHEDITNREQFINQVFRLTLNDIDILKQLFGKLDRDFLF